MDPSDPRHGTPAGERAHQKAGQTPCNPCRTAGRRARKIHEYNKAQGNPALIPLGHEAWTILTAYGNDIEAGKAIGMIHQKVWKLRTKGPHGIVRRTTRDRILAAPKPPTPIGLQRRLQALTARGWSMQHIADTTHTCNVEALKRLRRRETPRKVDTNVRHAIMTAWNQYAYAPMPDHPGAALTRALAVKHGYPPPLAWDDIDDPNERPRGRRTDRLDQRVTKLRPDDTQCPRCGIRFTTGTNTISAYCKDCRPHIKDAA